MSRVKTKWNRMSVRGKVLLMVSAICVLTMILLTFYFTVNDDLLDDYRHLMDDNVTCYGFQEAIEAERSAFVAFIRERSGENRAKYDAACEATRNAIDALPFDYEKIGRERYARTWNIRNGYAGYTLYRDAVMAADPGDPGFTDDFYRVQDMQESLEDYALKLVELTLEEGNAVYSQRERLFRLLPVLHIVHIMIAIASIFWILWMITRNVLRPILRMEAQTHRFEVGDFSVEDVAAQTEDEVGRLVTGFNHMKQGLADYFNTLEERNRMAETLHQKELAQMELEQHLDRTRLEMLKSQVNPHFLFNTLNMISCMARLEDASTTDRMILSLSNLFRYNLRTTEQEVWLEQEIAALADYVYIQQMRLDNRVTCHNHIQVDASAVKIPSFTLQPVVENAFIHGLRNKESDGRITLRVWMEGENLMVSIADNGRGMTAQELEDLKGKLRRSEQTSRGIGLGNICRRIEMMYEGGAYHIYSNPGRGTVIQFTIPQKKEER